MQNLKEQYYRNETTERIPWADFPGDLGMVAQAQGYGITLNPDYCSEARFGGTFIRGEAEIPFIAGWKPGTLMNAVVRSENKDQLMALAGVLEPFNGYTTPLCTYDTVTAGGEEISVMEWPTVARYQRWCSLSDAQATGAITNLETVPPGAMVFEPGAPEWGG